MTVILSAAGLLLYIFNYYIGWTLNSGRRPLSKTAHQIIYALLFLTLIFVVLSADMESIAFSFAGFSLIMLIILPFGKKGSMYHKIVSTIGLILYLLFIIS
jgi:hypothetical protein